MKKLICFSTFLLFSTCCFSYTKNDLQKAMFDNHPELQKLQAEYERSLLDVKDAKAGRGPTVELQISGTYMANPPVDAIYVNVDDILNAIRWPAGSKPASSGQYIKVYDGMENSYYNFGLQIMQPIFTWGKLTNAIKLYEKISEIKELQILSKKDEVKTELETRLTTVKYLEKILTVLEEEKEYAGRMVQVSEEAEKNGMLLHQEVVDAKIQAKELEIAQSDLQEQLNNQLLEIGRITGIENLTLADLDFDLNENQFDELLKCDRDLLQKNALSENQYSIKMLDDLKGVNELAVKIAKGYKSYKPDLALQMSLGYGGARMPLLEPNWLRKDEYSANLSVGVKTTLWDGGKKLNDVARKQSEEKTADINKIDATTTIKKTLNSQWNTADVCSMKIEYQNLKIEAAEAKIKQQETIFATGYGSETDVLSAKIDCCNQKIEKIRQQLTRAVACNTIEYLRGDINE